MLTCSAISCNQELPLWRKKAWHQTQYKYSRMVPLGSPGSECLECLVGFGGLWLCQLLHVENGTLDHLDQEGSSLWNRWRRGFRHVILLFSLPLQYDQIIVPNRVGHHRERQKRFLASPVVVCALAPRPREEHRAAS